MEKNETAVVTIEDMGVNGEGIGKVDGYTLFIKDAIIGDVVEAKLIKGKKNYGYARLMKVITPSQDRVPAKCEYARKCGGCQIQELSYEKQLEFKNGKVRENLQRIGGFSNEKLDAVMKPIIGMDEPFSYRNKAQFPVGYRKVVDPSNPNKKTHSAEPITGFYASRTHDIIANTDCVLGVPVNEDVLNAVLKYMKENKIKAYDELTGKGLIRHILIRYGFTSKEIMVCLVINGPELLKSEQLVEELVKIEGMTSITFSKNTRRSNVIMGDTYHTVWGQGYITDYIGDIKYQISPLSFYQVNPVQTKVLYEKALEYAGLTGKENVWDLYCGIGTISLFLAKNAKNVYGVEIVPQAIEDAKNNAKINGIKNAQFFVGKAEEVLPCEYEEHDAKADVIVVDPPRKGCDATLLNTMIAMQPERIVYVSCDSATLARDLKILCENGYELAECTPVDQFPMTVHCEIICALRRINTGK
ncbi:MAG: 23S rRNA (uracil(1939)-C(5))-methyltransferase RlmD [Hespellia sp.]|nr:23S rRNA (uracil(1939)-C(5))-methyltransferase RlmD [Hespellia sp.]